MRLIILPLIIGLSLASNVAVAAGTADQTTTVTSSSAKKTLKKKTAKSKSSVKKSLKSKTAKLTKKKAGGAELSTDVKFDDSVLHGQYQTPDEALAKVEDEKGLSDLLGLRKHFKDRLTTAAEQE